ncbi:MAG TPA: ABC transporter substrate-binding protein, partial [Thermoanaerobaculia bacterium]|nr:ABC transporter substrate-binding protein [Thermoanaerobaculia bacterium]
MTGLRILGLIPTLAALSFLAGCGAEKPPGAEGIRVGFFGALTGPTATFAQSGRNGVQMAVEELNAAGGVLGGKHIELLVEDDR